ncbi:hypothetical protein FH943_002659 [Enterococcus faecalis]|nr:hypothetical protein [Enterococcus faecalis]
MDTTGCTLTKGDIVSYKGENYISLVTHYNYGDGSWNPEEASSLFKIKY